MRNRVVRRPSLPLTEQDEHELELIRASPSYRSALANLSGEVGDAAVDLSEAALLHAVFEAGLDAVRLAAQEVGYSALAVERSEDAEARRPSARRRRPSWADEA